MKILESTIEALGTPLFSKHLCIDGKNTIALARWRHEAAQINAIDSDALQIALSLSGGHVIRQRVGKRRAARKVTAGSVGIICPGEPTVTEIEGSADVFQIFIPWSLIEETSESSMQHRFAAREIFDPRIRASAIGSFVAIHRGRPDDELLVTSRTYSIIERLVSWDGDRKAPSLGGLSPAAHRRVDELIYARLQDEDARPLSLSELALAARLTVHHFIKMFHQNTGTTPHAYVVGCRVKRAINLLTQNRSTVAEIADQTGFASSSHFVSLFRQHTGVTPGAFRAAILG